MSQSSGSRHHSSSLKVAMRPLQSSFFAGEDFLCQITFTNTNQRLAHTQPLLQGELPSAAGSSLQASPGRPSFDDKAARRVVSSIPTHSKSRSVDIRALGRGNHSWGSSSNLPASARSGEASRHLDGHVLPERRNLIGMSMPLPSTTHFVHPWSVSGGGAGSHRSTQSVSLTSSQRPRPNLGLGRPTLPASAATPTKLPAADSNRFSPNPPSRISSLPGLNTKRTPSAMISPNHSHSRKKSVAQVQAQDLTEAFQLDSLDSNLASAIPTAATPTSWLSHQPDPNTSFYSLGRNDTMESVFRESVTDWSHSKRRSSPSTTTGQGVKRAIYPPSDMLSPGTEKVLWSFAQLAGTIEIDESLIKPGDFENLKRRLAYGDLTGANATPHSLPGTPRTLGGGDLAQTSDADEQGAGGSKWSSILRSPFGGSRLQSHSRTGSTLQDAQERTMQSRSVPTFSTPPSIVAVDLLLAPGESKRFQFRLRLPVDLPPSYSGKAIRIKYVLSLGTNRLRMPQGRKEGRLISIPIRVYGYVGASGFRPFYDLMNPVIQTKEEAVVEVVGDDDKTPAAVLSGQGGRKANATTQIQKKDLQEYTKQLLKSKASDDTPTPELRISTIQACNNHNSSNSCKAAVEALARTATKVSYDISKDGKVAAVLTLVRSRYRLGETITGVININNSQSLARIARMSAVLETLEEIQPSIATLPAGPSQRATRIVHAEHHESVLDKGRAAFDLSIPSSASPEFVTSGVKLIWLVRLSFLTISATKTLAKAKQAQGATQKLQQSNLLPPPHLVPSPTDGFAKYHINLTALDSLAGPATHYINNQAATLLTTTGMARETKLETVECAIPISVLANSTTFKIGDALFFA
ncbi:hypothetical protein NDA10_004996 [Ustilago hordei]|nr:hypothetical protein NDA10_004996 [Ustilago hordei]UTT90888.1 hypothetical protein NDA17_001629 [Ustilago hordei]